MGRPAHGISMTWVVVVVVAAVASSSSSSAIVFNITETITNTTTTTTEAPRVSARPTGSQKHVHFPDASPSASRPQCLPMDTNGKADSEGITAFGMDVFRGLAKEGNVFFSPFNLWSALTLAYMGAEGETSLQMGRLLGLRGKRKALEFLNGLETELSQKFKGHQNLSLEAASRIYINEGFEINSCLHASLSSRLQTLDFSRLTEAAHTINSYVNTATRGLIPTIVSGEQLVDTQMAIISAIYFYGSWETAFEPKFTLDAAFHPDPDTHTAEKVKMMYMKNSLLLGKSDELSARVLRLPYATGRVSMYLLLPTTAGREGYDATLRALTPTTLHAAINGLTESMVEVQLPKFKMERNYEETLKQTLKNLGATHMFDSWLANFHSFSPSVYLSTVIHKAFVDVSEAGTEAAAVTAVLIDVRSSRAEAQPFVCDRPFIFIIYDEVAQVTLFMGAFKKPPTA